MTQVPAQRLVFLTCHLSHFCFSGPEWESFICKFVRFCVIEWLIGKKIKLVFGAINIHAQQGSVAPGGLNGRQFGCGSVDGFLNAIMLPAKL